MANPNQILLDIMLRRATTPVADGDPIIPEGPLATTQDMQEFKRPVEAMGYEIKFGQNRAATNPGKKLVQLTGRCTVGILCDEFLHVWNNHLLRRGKYLSSPVMTGEHLYLGNTFRLSGSSNDRRFHQLELENYAQFLSATGASIPGFVWRTFSSLKQA